MSFTSPLLFYSDSLCIFLVFLFIFISRGCTVAPTTEAHPRLIASGPSEGARRRSLERRRRTLDDRARRERETERRRLRSDAHQIDRK